MEEVEAKGDRAVLGPEDGRFVDFCEGLRDYNARKPYMFEEAVYNFFDKNDPKPPTTLKIKGCTLAKLDYEEVLNPRSTGALKLSFWKSEKGEYFYRVSGGCVAYQDQLFGQFKLEDGKFVFKGQLKA